jgi:hypothetical protein
MEQQTLYSRWHCFDEQGVKYIKNSPIGEKPALEGNLTEWKRGTGASDICRLRSATQCAERERCSEFYK